jgi:hypothetical protein
MAGELSDAEVFGTSAELSDDQVFGTPPSARQSFTRGVGLGARDVIEGTLGPAYDLVGSGINALGIMPPINTLSQNLTKLGMPAPETTRERVISGIQQPIAGTLTGQGVGRAMIGAASPVVQTVGQALTAQPGMQALSAGVGGATTEATGSPTAGLAASMLTPFAAAGAGMAGRTIENAALGGLSKPDAELGRLAIDKYKIPVGAPDLTDNTLIRTGVDQAGKLPFSGVRPAAEAKHAAWQKAIATEFGDPSATNFTPEVLSPAATRIGAGFDAVAARTSIPPAETTTLVQDLDGVLHNAKRLLQAGELQPIETQINDIKALIADNNGTLSGEAYQKLTNTRSLLARLEKQNTNAGELAGDVRDHIDDAFARSASPDDQEALQRLRYQYRVLRTVDQLAAGSRTGDITPDGFMQKVLTTSRKFDSPLGGIAYTGGGNIGELARIGKLMRAAPQTGTADRALINAGVGALSGLTAAGGAAQLINPWNAVGIPAGLTANRLVGGYLRSAPLANRLIENTIGPVTPRQNPLLGALQASQAAALEAEYQRLRR